LLEPRLACLYNLILVIINLLTKVLILIPTEEIIIAKETVHKIIKALIS
jgi:hypothetical protein